MSAILCLRGLPDGIPAGAMEPGTFAFITNIGFINSRYLIARAHKSDHYIFDLSKNDYELARKINFRPINDTEERKNISPADFLLHKNHLYVSSPWEEYVYGYDFDL